MVAAQTGRGGRRAEDNPAPPERGLTFRRQATAVALAVVGLPCLTWAGTMIASTPTSESIFLVYLLAVVVICVIGGLLPGLLAAVAAFLLANWFLTPPVRTLTVSSPAALADLVVFLLVAAIVSVTVEVGARNRARAARNRYEAQLVHRLGGAEMRGVTPEEILEQVRELYSMRSVRLLDPTGRRATVSVGPTPDEPAVLSIDVVENALRFSPPQEPVRIDAAVVPSEPTRVELRVTDHGPGVPPERWDEMFQPFQRLGDTTTGGVGLGLAIARGLTEAMRGTITPTNSPDGGLTMVVRLPVAS